MALTLRPNCECCDKDLPPHASEARICSFECTFCETCVNEVLFNVCPNCGGNFVPRPIRPKHAFRPGVSLATRPASTERVHTRYSKDEITALALPIRHIDPVDR